MRSNNNNPLTRDEILSRYFPQYRPAVAASQGLSGGSCIIDHDTHRVVLRRHHDPTLHQPIFYVITAPYPNCRPVLRRERFFIRQAGWR
ncbi:thiamine kinase [Salmonella enterica subsp. enterica]|uniref:Thiamine kinase n=1 Tax=Salmonella enterica I TaxID=59201 RepID=A0A447PF21_SALET|nr:thiamine kinase [Salmonella enterica subsp. enterica]